MTMPDTQSFLGRALTGGGDEGEERPKLSWVKFGDVGDEVDLTITDKGMAPDYEFSRNPDAPKVQKTWDNGEPMFFMVVTGKLNKPTVVGDGSKTGRTAPEGEEVNLAVKGKRQTGSIAKALREVGETDLNVGGRLWQKFTGWEMAKKGEAKTYDAKYKPGAPPSTDTSGFLGTSEGSANGGGLSAPAGKAPKDDQPPF